MKAIIIGAGPAGLSCAYELVKKNVKVEIFEASDAYNITITDLLGQVVVQKKYPSSGGDQTAHLSLGDLPNGIYLVSVKDNDGILSETISVAR